MNCNTAFRSPMVASAGKPPKICCAKPTKNYSPIIDTMYKLPATLLLTLSTLIVAGAQAYQPEDKPDNQWSAIKQPTADAPEAIGSYANGCLRGAELLEPSGTGYLDMRRNRGRYYGQPELITFIRDLGEFTHQRYGHKHLIGDLSQARGGRMNFGHSSHQVGLDVDIWLQTLPDQQAVSPFRDMQSIVNKAAGTIIGGNIAPPIRDALHYAATYPGVARVFVNPVIKWHLCQSEKDTAWLNTLRPWWGHDQHFHVRLSCPANQPNCHNQKPLKNGRKFYPTPAGYYCHKKY
ncbi:MAG: penicillin-insensitive murein endopeptidase [Gammaproteobacteria bacterium]|nr:MAG: penicillin-insensitive murein endopeptidase [Gammaproteobacteria bacterium]